MESVRQLHLCSWGGAPIEAADNLDSLGATAHLRPQSHTALHYLMYVSTPVTHHRTLLLFCFVLSLHLSL
jgi:hypothetical protein